MLAKWAAAAGGVALALFSTTAFARECSGGAFGGTYIGVSAGYASLDTEGSSPSTGKVSFDDSGFAIGGHLGHNIQCDRVVFGVEGDLSYLGLEDKRIVNVTGYDVNLKDELSWFGTLRGRLGVAIDDRMLVYVTGGLAFADYDHKVGFVGTGCTDCGFQQTNSGRATGWALGGGMELLRENRWTFRAEALYVDLGEEKHRYTTTACDCDVDEVGKWEDQFWVARVGFSYKFGHREDHVPLK